MKKAITISILLLPIVCFALNGSSIKHKADKNCQGNACDVTQIVPNPTGGYKFTNTSNNRKIKITIRFAFGWSCMSPTDIHLQPGQTAKFGNGGYCDPYTSNFE